MSRVTKIPKIEEQKKYKQTLKDFISDIDRRIPNKNKLTVAVYYWSPSESTQSRKEIKMLFETYTQLFKKYYPKLKLQLMPLFDENSLIGKGKDAFSIIHKDKIYNAKKLFDSFEKSINNSQNNIFANILIVNVIMSNRPGLTVEGIARRETGLAIISTHKCSVLTIIHEMAHLLGIRHCDFLCIMMEGKENSHLKPKLDKNKEIDIFCEQCTTKITETFKLLPIDKS